MTSPSAERQVPPLVYPPPGRAAHHLAYPSGEHNADTYTAAAAVGILTARSDGGWNLNQVPPIADLYHLERVFTIPSISGVEGSKQQLSSTTPGQIMFYMGHIVGDGGAGEMPVADFAELVAYVKEAGCRVVTISQLYAYIQAGYVWP